jgi:SsrA-binding protein
MSKPDSGKTVIATNKDAGFRYFIEDTFEAGIELMGTEVKSLRTGKVQMNDSYVYVKGGQAFLAHMHISEYSHGNRENHLPMRERRLLLHRREIDRLAAAVNEKGMAIIPLQLYFVKGRAKVEIGLGRGKKLHDKRATLKEKEAKREIDRSLKR